MHLVNIRKIMQYNHANDIISICVQKKLNNYNFSNLRII